MADKANHLEHIFRLTQDGEDVGGLTLKYGDGVVEPPFADDEAEFVRSLASQLPETVSVGVSGGVIVETQGGQPAHPDRVLEIGALLVHTVNEQFHQTAS